LHPDVFNAGLSFRHRVGRDDDGGGTHALIGEPIKLNGYIPAPANLRDLPAQNGMGQQAFGDVRVIQHACHCRFE
jgi:hypothetical protein